MSTNAARRLATEIAVALGESWTAHDDLTLTNNHEQLILSVDHDRVCVSGCWPQETATAHMHRLDYGTISVAVSRGATIIAKETRRRLLPQYRESLRITLARKTAHDVRTAEITALLSQVQTALASLGQYHHRDDSRLIAGEWGDPLTADVEVSRFPQHGATIKLRVDQDLLVMVTRAIGAVRADHNRKAETRAKASELDTLDGAQ